MKSKKCKFKNFLKTALILIVFALSYFISAVTSSIYQTNIKLITLLICFVCGVLLFFIVYGALYLIALFKISKKTKKLINDEISCDDRASDFFNSNGYRFSYDLDKTFSKNIDSLKLDVVKFVKEIADGYGGHDNKYYYLGYTVYDAIDVIDGAIDLLDSKVSPIFKFLKIEDKPLKSVEHVLEKAINNDEKNDVISDEKKSSFFKKAGEKIVKATAYVFRGKIESTVTDVVKFIGFKAFELYSKNGNDYKPERSGRKLK